jgi:hypothetical protein
MLDEKNLKINISLRDDIIVLFYENKGIIKEDVF